MYEQPKTSTLVDERPAPRTPDTEVPEYVKDQIMNDLWDRTTDLGLIHDPIFTRAD